MTQGILYFLRDYWELILLVATWLGIFLIALRRRSDWIHKRFLKQVNFSLNYVQDGTLMLRTLMEESAQRVWLNDYGVQQVLRAARNTRADQPFLRLHSTRDMDYVKRAALNVLSERYSDAFVARSMGMDVRTERFLFGITWERYGNVRTQKLRVIIVRAQDLDAIFDGGDGSDLKFASKSHKDRITTLRRMHRISRSRRHGVRNMLGEVELGVIVPQVKEVRQVRLPESVTGTQAEGLVKEPAEVAEPAEGHEPVEPAERPLPIIVEPRLDAPERVEHPTLH